MRYRSVTLNKRWIPVLTRARGADCRLKLNDLVVYSFLVSRVRAGKTFSQRHLARVTGIGVNTFTDIKGRLTEHGLLGFTKRGRWYARKPEGKAASWFTPRRRGGPEWHRSYAYWAYYPPSVESPLTMSQAAVWSVLASYGVSMSRKGLARTIKVSTQTAATAITKLAEHGLVTVGKARLTPVVPTGDRLGWFQDKGSRPAAKKPRPETTVLPTKPEAPAPAEKAPRTGIHKVLDAIHEEGRYEPEQVQNLYDVFQVSDLTADDLLGMFRAAEREHDREQYSTTSYHLLKHRLEHRVVERVKSRREMERLTRMRA